MNNKEEQRPRRRSTTFIYGGITVIVVVLVLALYISVSRSKVSADYIDKFDAVAELYQKISTDSQSAAEQLASSTVSLSDKERVKDYNGAAQVVSQSVTNISNLIDEVNSMNARIDDFSTTAERVGDVKIRTDSIGVVSLWRQGNAYFLKLLDYENQVLLPTEQYYKDLAAGREATALTVVQDQVISQNIKSETDNMSSLGPDIQAAYSKLSADIGVQL